MKICFLLILFLISAPVALGMKQFKMSQFNLLRQNEVFVGFQTKHLLKDSENKIMGAQFLHQKSHAPVHILQIDTVPQAFLWVQVADLSNQGLPHALEHLLAGKGTKGRFANLFQEMNIGHSGAATASDFVYYHFDSSLASNSFFQQLHSWLDALFSPDFTDLEAEREFYHIGAEFNSTHQRFRLVEKGTVYNEMLKSHKIWDYHFGLNMQILGPGQPQSYKMGGDPDDMRAVTAQDIRAFHKKYYQVGPNTGFIFVVRPDTPIETYMAKINEELLFFYKDNSKNVDPEAAGIKTSLRQNSGLQIKDPKPSTPLIFPFPTKTNLENGAVRIGWPQIKIDSKEEYQKLNLLMMALTEGENSILYDSLISHPDSRFQINASGVSGEINSGVIGSGPNSRNPFLSMTFSGIPGNQINSNFLTDLRSVVLKNIQHLEQLRGKSQALVRLNRKLLVYMKSHRRIRKIWLKSPPLFGYYESLDEWKQFLDYQELDSGFIRSMSNDLELSKFSEQLEAGENVWRPLIHKYKLLSIPFITASIPSPKLLKELQQSAETRLTTKSNELKKLYQTENDQIAFEMFYRDEIKKDKSIDEISDKVPRPTFAMTPPLSPDDSVEFSKSKINKTPIVFSLFNESPTIDLGLSFDLRGLDNNLRMYIPLLGPLLLNTGIKEGLRTTSFNGVAELIQSKVYRLNSEFKYHGQKNIADFRINISAQDPKELLESLNLLSRLIKNCDLSMSNLSRVRNLTRLNLPFDQFSPEHWDSSWISDPVESFRYQSTPLFLILHSRFTQEHLMQRILWRLHEPVLKKNLLNLKKYSRSLLEEIRNKGRVGIEKHLRSSTSTHNNTTALESELNQYWLQNIPLIPESEIHKSLLQLRDEVLADLEYGPQQTLNDLKTLHKKLYIGSYLNMDLGSKKSAVKEVKPILQKFLTKLERSIVTEKLLNVATDSKTPVLDKLKRRLAVDEFKYPYYLGMESSESPMANIIFNFRTPDLTDLSSSALLEHLAGQLFAGSSPHSLFMKTWEAGLAYSNGINFQRNSGKFEYVAYQVPSIQSLLLLVTEVLKSERISGNSSFIVDSVFAQSFSNIRESRPYAERAAALAWDIRTGADPYRYKLFSTAILKLRETPNLLNRILESKKRLVSTILMDSPEKVKRDAEAIFFFSSSRLKLEEAQALLPSQKIFLMYPSDFWL